MFEWFMRDPISPTEARIDELKVEILENKNKKLHPEMAILNEIEAIMHILRLPNFVLPIEGESRFEAAVKIRYALMNIRKKLEYINTVKGE
jgi:hypothetical protein